MATASHFMDEGSGHGLVLYLPHHQAVPGQGNCGASERVRKTCSKDGLPEQSEVAEDGEPQD